MARWGKRILIAGLLGAALMVAAGALGFAYLQARLPDVFSYDAYRRIALESTRVHAAGGELLARFGPENRTVVPLSRIPKSLLFATVCAEDASFFHHPGLDLAGIARAIWVDVTEGRYAQGASTITQQFAKTRFLSNEKTIVRKLKELVLARKLEQKLQKNDILAMYLNEIYFGHGRYGVQEAARFYFDKPAAQLDLAEAALLAGLLNSPERLSPLRNAELAAKRRAYVLDQMQRRGYITAADAARANDRPLPGKPGKELDLEAPYYVSEVRSRLRKLVAPEVLRRGGLRVEVALDAQAQQSAQKAVIAGLQRIDRKLQLARPARHLDTEAQLRAFTERAAKQRRKRPFGPGRVALGVVLHNQPGPCRYVLDVGGEPAILPHESLGRYARGDGEVVVYRRGDVVRVGYLAPTTLEDGQQAVTVTLEQGPQAALVALEPHTRLVRALVGGYDFETHRFNRAMHALRQPGSTFKTFVMAAALEAEIASPDTVFKDEKRSYRSGGRRWTPRNYSGRWDGKEHTMRGALARSINSITVAIADKVGPERVAEMARRLGIDSELKADLPLALGASSVRPIELASAYATIASGGTRGAPILITRVLDREGRELYRASPQPERAIAEPIAAALTDMLGDVVRYGSARSATIGRPIAGKTGTTNRGRDTWFAGFSADLAAVVWVGHDDREPIEKGTGAKLALPIWTRFMRGALKGVPIKPLGRLPHVVHHKPVAGADDDALEAVDDEVLEEYARQL